MRLLERIRDKIDIKKAKRLGEELACSKFTSGGTFDDNVRYEHLEINIHEILDTLKIEGLPRVDWVANSYDYLFYYNANLFSWLSANRTRFLTKLSLGEFSHYKSKGCKIYLPGNEVYRYETSSTL